MKTAKDSLVAAGEACNALNDRLRDFSQRIPEVYREEFMTLTRNDEATLREFCRAHTELGVDIFNTAVELRKQERECASRFREAHNVFYRITKEVADDMDRVWQQGRQNGRQ